MTDVPPQFEDVAEVIQYQLSRRSVVGGAAALAASGLLSACSGKGGSYSDKPANQTGATKAVQIGKANIPTPREETVIIAQVDYTVFNSWNGLIPNGFPASAGYESVVREAMFYLNLATGELLPWLATSYKYNDTHTELTFTFDPKAKWSDGQPFTSSDFKFTVLLLRDHKDLLGGGGDLAEFVKSVETPDAHTAVIKMLKPAPTCCSRRSRARRRSSGRRTRTTGTRTSSTRYRGTSSSRARQSRPTPRRWPSSGQSSTSARSTSSTRRSSATRATRT